MEPQNEVLTAKTSMINDSTLQNNIPSSLEEQPPEVNRTRNILLILISTLLILCFINFVFVPYLYTINDSREDQLSNISSQLVAIFISFAYYGFGFLVTYRYYQTGLFVFAWLGFIFLLLISVIVIFIIVAIIVVISHLGFVKKVLVAIIFVMICLMASLLQSFTVRYAFTLSKLMKNTKPLTTEEI